MKKADELMLYTPEPKRPPLDARLCISVAEGLGQGRYIKGKTLTVAVWDNCKSPLVVWRFCGDYWTENCAGRRTLAGGFCALITSMQDVVARLSTPMELQPCRKNQSCYRIILETDGLGI